jgi:predicted RNA-binding protein Jag
MEHIIFPLVNEFFMKLGIIVTTITVDQIREDINIRVETPDSALVIGIHGKNIEIFQYLLSRIIERTMKEHIHVHLEINDYMKQKEEKLYHFLDSKIKIVTTTGQLVKLPSLSPYERKKAHWYIADKHIVGLSTQSEWEWTERILILSYTGEVRQEVHSNSQNNITPKTDLISDDGVGI